MFVKRKSDTAKMIERLAASLLVMFLMVLSIPFFAVPVKAYWSPLEVWSNCRTVTDGRKIAITYDYDYQRVANDLRANETITEYSTSFQVNTPVWERFSLDYYELNIDKTEMTFYYTSVHEDFSFEPGTTYSADHSISIKTAVNGTPVYRENNTLRNPFRFVATEYNTEEPPVEEDIETTTYQFTLTFGQSEARSGLAEINEYRRSMGMEPFVYDYGIEQDIRDMTISAALSPTGNLLNGKSNNKYSMDRFLACSGSPQDVHGAVQYALDADYIYNSKYKYIAIGHVVYEGEHAWIFAASDKPEDLQYTPADDSTGNIDVEIADKYISSESYFLEERNPKVAYTNGKKEATEIYLSKGDTLPLPLLYKRIVIADGSQTNTVNTSVFDAEWTSDDSSVFSINGMESYGIKGGETVAHVRYRDYEKSLPVYVEKISVKDITLNADKLTLEVGQTAKLYATVMPEDADDNTVTWSSSNTSVAEVSKDGTVTAKGKGTANIKARTANGVNVLCYVTVNAKKEVISDGFHQNDRGWFLYNNGKINYSFSGLYCDDTFGWWLVLNGEVAFDYNDFYCDTNYGWWLVQGGRVAFEVNDFYCSPSYGWWLVQGGRVAFEVNDFYCSPSYGWWLVQGGRVAFEVNDFYCSPSYGWWLVENGNVAFYYDDIYKSAAYGPWKVKGGQVDFGYTGVYTSGRYGKCYVSGGAASF